MNLDILSVISSVAESRDINREELIEIIKDAFKKAYAKISPDSIFEIEIDSKKGQINCYEVLEVVDDEKEFEKYDLQNNLGFDDVVQILHKDAIKLNKNAAVGDKIKKPIDLKEFKPKNISQIGNLIRQRITEIHNKKIAEEWRPKKGTVIYARVAELNVSKNNLSNGTIVSGVKVELDDKWKTLGYISKKDYLNKEELKTDHSYYFLIKDVKEQGRLWPVLLSRSEPQVIKAVLENEILDLKNKTIEIVAIERKNNFKTKIAVVSNNKNIDPLTAIVGVGGTNIKRISAILGGEKIDVIKYSEDPYTYIAEAVGISKIQGLNVYENESGQRTAVVIVKTDNDLSEVIGRNGYNIQMIAKLTRWNIDVKTVKQAIEQGISYSVFSKETLHKHNINRIVKETKTNDEVLADYNNLVFDSIEEEKNQEEFKEETKTLDIKEEKQQTQKPNPKSEDENVDDDFEILEGFEDLDLEDFNPKK